VTDLAGIRPPAVSHIGVKSENRDGSGQSWDSLRSGGGRVERSVTDRPKSLTMHGISQITSVCCCVLFKVKYDFSGMKLQTTVFPKGVSIGTVHRFRDRTSVLLFGSMVLSLWSVSSSLNCQVLMSVESWCGSVDTNTWVS
jgi:hypothetical protein